MDFTFDLHKIDWTAVSAIVSCIMIVLTTLSLLQNKRQMREMKRQWKETNRARIEISIFSRDLWMNLQITNVGKETAYDVSVTIDETFIKDIPFKELREHLQELTEPFILQSGKSKYYSLMPVRRMKEDIITYGSKSLHSSQTNEWFESNFKRKFNIRCEYCNLYHLDMNVSISQFLRNGLIIDDKLTESVKRIEDKLIVHNDGYMPIQKSLHIIADAINKKDDGKFA